MFEGLFENLRFQRLLAQEPIKFANLVLQSPIIRSRHDLFPAAGRGQAALRHQPTPGEQLVWGNAMPTSHQAYRHTRLEGLFDHANLLRGRPAPTTLNRRDDLNAIRRIGHRHGCMPHTCQVGERVRSVRGLSHEVISADVAAPSPDDRFHHCIYYPLAKVADPWSGPVWEDKPKTRCFFAPMNST